MFCLTFLCHYNTTKPIFIFTNCQISFKTSIIKLQACFRVKHLVKITFQLRKYGVYISMKTKFISFSIFSLGTCPFKILEHFFSSSHQHFLSRKTNFISQFFQHTYLSQLSEYAKIIQGIDLVKSIFKYYT